MIYLISSQTIDHNSRKSLRLLEYFRRSFTVNIIISLVLLFLVLNLLVSIDEIFEDVLKAHIRACEKPKESHEEDEEVLNQSGPGAVVALSDGVYDRWSHQSQS